MVRSRWRTPDPETFGMGRMVETPTALQKRRGGAVQLVVHRSIAPGGEGQERQAGLTITPEE
jgi:hypothetical protein